MINPMNLKFGKKAEPKSLEPRVPEEQKTPADGIVPKEQQKIYMGLFFIVLAFVGASSIIYIMMHTGLVKEKEIEGLKSNMVSLQDEKNLAQIKIQDMEQEIAKAPELNKIVAQAGQLYGEQEKSRKEGFLWIDRKGDAMIVTVGALNGLSIGSRLAVYDGNKRLGYVKVDLAMDVISYVLPEDLTLNDFKKDYYRVTTE